VKSFDQLGTRLKIGDTVWVTDAQGREIRAALRRSRPDAVGVDAMALSAEGRQRPRRRAPPPNSLANGAFDRARVGLRARGSSWPRRRVQRRRLLVGRSDLVALMFAGVGTGLASA